MRRIQKVAYALGGFVLGVLFTSAVWLWVEIQPDYFSAASVGKSEREIAPGKESDEAVHLCHEPGETESVIPSINLLWTVGLIGRRQEGCPLTRSCWASHFMPGQAGRGMGRFWRVCPMPVIKIMSLITAWKSIITV